MNNDHSMAHALPPAPGSGRRERQKAETRGRLLAAARRLFTERGFDATRPQDIARQADLAVGTFYVHFPDKRAAFLAVTEQAAHEVMEQIRERADGTAGFEHGLRASLEALLAYSDAHPGLLSACFADARVISRGLPGGASLRERFAQNLAQGLRRGMARGDLRADYDAEVIAAGIVGLVQHALAHGREPADRPTLLENVTRFCARALLQPEPTSLAEPAAAAPAAAGSTEKRT